MASFKVDDSIGHDLKFMRLTSSQRSAWLEILCIISEANTRGKTSSTSDIIVLMRRRRSDTEKMLTVLETAGLLEHTIDDAWLPAKYVVVGRKTA